MDELCSRHSDYHDMTVEEHDGLIELRFSGRSQGATDAATRLELIAPVFSCLTIPVALVRSPKRVLVMGLGGGVLPRRFLRDYPEMSVDVVEIDPEVVRVCGEYFGLPDDPRLRIIVEGGREYLQRTREIYDIIIIDAFFVHPTAGLATPFELVTVEFFSLARSRLSANGVVGSNVTGVLHGRGSDPLHRLYRSMLDVFASAHLIEVSASRSRAAGRKNYVAIGTNSPLPAADVRTRIRDAADATISIAGFASLADDLIEKPFSLRGVRAYHDADMPQTGLMPG